MIEGRPAWGAGGREFKSHRPDQIIKYLIPDQFSRMVKTAGQFSCLRCRNSGPNIQSTAAVDVVHGCRAAADISVGDRIWLDAPAALNVIEFFQAENRMLKGRLRGKRIRFTELGISVKPMSERL
jgi:hypothetical protein